MRRLRGGFAALFAQLLFVAAASAATVEYVYIEPDAGSSAGGHVAIRLADDVYDFQNHALHTLRLRRTPWDEFRYLYSVLENRTLKLARIETPDAVAETLQEAFNRRFLEQNRRFARLDDRRRDLALIERLGDPGRAGAATAGDVTDLLRLRGAGFFFGDETPGGESQALRDLRTHVGDRHGGEFLATKLSALEAEIASLQPGPEFSNRLTDLSLKLLALRVLRDATPVRPVVLRRAPEDAPPLAARERERLARLARELESALVDLVLSRRPDWGFPALLGMARLQAIAASLASGRLVFLDAYPADSGGLTKLAIGNGAYLSELREHARAELARARAHWAAADRVQEPDYAWLEDAANRFVEIREAVATGRAIRIRGENRLPALVATGIALPLPSLDPARLRRAAEHAAERVRSDAASLRESLGYHLVTHNCVTEIFATLEAELGRAGSEEHLGGYLAASGSFDFIPAVAYGSVVATYRVSEVGEVPSLRRTRMAEQYAAEPDGWVYLRESNTLSSTVYRRNERDSIFLFFTNDAIATRPVFGAFNLAAGIGQSVFGVFRAPFDRGHTLWSGINGIAVSLPELVFVNLRKGILEYAPGASPRTLAHFRPHAARKRR